MPVAQESQIAQQYVKQQGNPNLPMYGVSTVAEKVSQVERLFDLPEEFLDIPATPIKLRYTLWTPVQVVGQKLHLDPLALEFHPRHYPPQHLGIQTAGLGTSQVNELIAQNVALWSTLAPA